MPKPCFLRDGSQLFGLDAELYFKAEASRDAAWETSLLEWVEKVTNCEVDKTDVWACLKSGVLLCKLMNGIKDGAIPRFAERPAKKRTSLHLLEEIDNIKLYLAACKALGLGATQLFDLEDLLKGRGMIQVMHNLYCVATFATQESENLSFDGPFFEVSKQVKRNRGATFLARVDRWNGSPKKDTLRVSPRKTSPTKREALSPTKRTQAPTKKQSRSVTIDMKEATAMLDNGRTLHLLQEQRNPLCVVKKKALFYRVKGLTSAEDALCWGSPWHARTDKKEAAEDSLYFNDLTAVVLGKLAKNFISEAAKLSETNCCFSLITATRSVDLIADSCELRDLWLFGIGGILAQMNKQIALGEGSAEDKGDNWQRFFVRPVQKVELVPHQLDISQIALAFPDQGAVSELLANQSDKILALEAKIASMTGNLTELQLPKTLSLAVREELQAAPEVKEALRKEGRARQDLLCDRLSTPQRRAEPTLGLKLSSVHPLRYDVTSPSVARAKVSKALPPHPPSSKPPPSVPVARSKFTLRKSLAPDPLLLRLAELLLSPSSPLLPPSSLLPPPPPAVAGPELLPACLAAAERLTKELREQTRKRRELQRHIGSQAVRTLCRLRGAEHGPWKAGRNARVGTDGHILTFDRIFAPECSQADVFDELESLIEGCEEGKQACVFVAGLAGSGKSFTLHGSAQEGGLLPRAVGSLLSGAGELSGCHLHVFDNRILDANSQEQVLLEDTKEGLRCGEVWSKIATIEQASQMFSTQRPSAVSSVIGLRKYLGNSQVGFLVFVEVAAGQTQGVSDVFQCKTDSSASMLTALLHHFVAEEGSHAVLLTTIEPSLYELSCVLQSTEPHQPSQPSLRRKLSSPRHTAPRSPTSTPHRRPVPSPSHAAIASPSRLSIASHFAASPPRIPITSPTHTHPRASIVSPRQVSSPCSPVKTQGDMELVKNLTALAKTANAENQRLENLVALQAARIQELEALLPQTPSLGPCTATSTTRPLQISLSPLSEICPLGTSPFDTLASISPTTFTFNNNSTTVLSDPFPEGQDVITYHTLRKSESDTLPISILHRMKTEASQQQPARIEPSDDDAPHKPIGSLPQSILDKLTRGSPKASRTLARESPKVGRTPARAAVGPDTTRVRDPPFSSATVLKLFSPPKFPTLKPNNTLTPATLRVQKKPPLPTTLRVNTAAAQKPPTKTLAPPDAGHKRTRDLRSPLKPTIPPSRAPPVPRTRPPLHPTAKPRPDATTATATLATAKRLKPETMIRQPKPFR